MNPSTEDMKQQFITELVLFSPKYNVLLAEELASSYSEEDLRNLLNMLQEINNQRFDALDELAEKNPEVYEQKMEEEKIAEEKASTFYFDELQKDLLRNVDEAEEINQSAENDIDHLADEAELSIEEQSELAKSLLEEIAADFREISKNSEGIDAETVTKAMEQKHTSIQVPDKKENNTDITNQNKVVAAGIPFQEAKNQGNTDNTSAVVANEKDTLDEIKEEGINKQVQLTPRNKENIMKELWLTYQAILPIIENQVLLTNKGKVKENNFDASLAIRDIQFIQRAIDIFTQYNKLHQLPSNITEILTFALTANPSIRYRFPVSQNMLILISEFLNENKPVGGLSRMFSLGDSVTPQVYTRLKTFVEEVSTMVLEPLNNDETVMYSENGAAIADVKAINPDKYVENYLKRNS